LDITDEQLDSADDFLGQIVKERKAPLTQYQAVYRLRHQLKKAVKRKVSYEELAQKLNSQGWEITPVTLRQYLSQAFSRRKSQTETKDRERKKPEVDNNSSHSKSELKSKRSQTKAQKTQGESLEQIMLSESEKGMKTALDGTEEPLINKINEQSNQLASFDDDGYQPPLITIRK
jgi:hypothetical protein